MVFSLSGTKNSFPFKARFRYVHTSSIYVGLLYNCAKERKTFTELEFCVNELLLFPAATNEIVFGIRNALSRAE